MLTGDEVKSLRGGRASLTEAFARVRDGEVWLEGMHVPPYEQGDKRGTCRRAPGSCCCTAGRSRSSPPSSRSNVWRSCRCASTSPTAWPRSRSGSRGKRSTRSASRSRNGSRSGRSPGARSPPLMSYRQAMSPTPPDADELEAVIAFVEG